MMKITKMIAPYHKKEIVFQTKERIIYMDGTSESLVKRNILNEK